jgi:hypothetical protein
MEGGREMNDGRQLALDTFGFLVIGYSHEEEAAKDEAKGFVNGPVCHDGELLQTHAAVIGRATKEDWHRQHQLYGESTPLGFHAFLKVIAE